MKLRILGNQLEDSRNPAVKGVVQSNNLPQRILLVEVLCRGNFSNQKGKRLIEGSFGIPPR
jgi:hypothetical protein